MSFIKSLKYLRRYAVRLFIKTISSNSSLSNGNVVIVAPHPDDEVFACAGLIAYKKTKNARVSVIFLTDGEAAHRGCCNAAPEKIGIARRRLAIEAGNILGLKADDMFWLELEDGDIPRSDNPDFKNAVDRMVILINEMMPQEIYAPHYLDCWPDHEAASDIVKEALKEVKCRCNLFYYPVWMWHNLCFRSLPEVLKSKIIRIDISRSLDRKKAAIDHYLSALNPDCGKPFCGNLPHGFVDHFRYDYEIFFKSENHC